jgi:hypothetical protein
MMFESSKGMLLTLPCSCAPVAQMEEQPLRMGRPLVRVESGVSNAAL